MARKKMNKKELQKREGMIAMHNENDECFFQKIYRSGLRGKKAR